jgi:hypothetical protein
MLLGLIGMAVVVSGCANPTGTDAAAEAEANPPGTVKHIDATNTDQVILTADAATLLGIMTQPVRDEQVGTGTRAVMPYAAILYDESGEAWTYVNPEPLTFVRERITIESIQGDRVILAKGPATGTSVVTVGATELYGTEFGVSGDE